MKGWTLYRAREGRGFVAKRIELFAYVGINIVYGSVFIKHFRDESGWPKISQLIFPDEIYNL